MQSSDTHNGLNRNYEPSENEEAVLRVLKDGRANPLRVREETGFTKQSVNNYLTRLTVAGWVRKVNRGLYELVADPRDE